ncbi:MAG: VOC family protein, partial [Gemmatimonadales bacterium]|nr:VOC family protein [Gemmatimonadales bacterium]
MDHTIVHFEIPADDPERAAKFYRELFGWQIDRYAGSG